MTGAKTTGLALLSAVLLVGAAGTAMAQAAPEQPGDPHHPEAEAQAQAPQAGPAPAPGQGMMDPAMMRAMHEMMHGVMSSGREQPGMGPGMMGQGMGPGMMGQGSMGQGTGPGMMPQMPGMTGQGMAMGPGTMGMMGGETHPQQMHGLRVVPITHLSTDDVRHFLEHHIEAHGLEHLQVGAVEQTDENTITADIETREGSLAMRVVVDRHTGFIEDVS